MCQKSDVNVINICKRLHHRSLTVIERTLVRREQIKENRTMSSKKGCNLRTKHFGRIFWCCLFAFESGNWSWTMLTLDKIKGRETKICHVYSDSKDTKQKHGSTITQGPAMSSGGCGYRWTYPFCVKWLQKVFDDPWDGSAMKDSMR